MGRSLNDLRFNGDSADFSDCNSDRSGEFSTASSQSQRLLVACDTENSDQLIRQLVPALMRDQSRIKSKWRWRSGSSPRTSPRTESRSLAPLQEYGVTAILNLSLYDENKELIASSLAIKPLVRALKVGTSTARENPAYAHLIKVGTSTKSIN
ncbi:uncharacterized protein LOC132269702 [Cornus florida]|uniref:uncharacterized protein LOC132269702 n=1 Tax=Cornus florida TaxID=4283 RepID=UPI00289FDAD2|nr:uncharacterized protein LOC132269702 [Cornus florida]